MDLLQNRLYHQITNLSDLIDEYDAFLFDIWGVLHEGGELYEGINILINKIATSKVVRIISNAPRLRTTAGGNLIEKGMNIDIDMVYTSGETARNILRNSQELLNLRDPLIYHMGGERNEELLSGLNARETKIIEEADLLLMSAFRDIGEVHTDIIKILELAAAYKIPALCANPDQEVLHLGNVRYCAGYFANIYEKLEGKVSYSGKPEKIIFEECLTSFNSKDKRILMVGDTFATDIQGANQLGIDSALVLTGNMGRAMNKLNINDKLLAANTICSQQSYLPTHLISMK